MTTIAAASGCYCLAAAASRQRMGSSWCQRCSSLPITSIALTSSPAAGKHVVFQTQKLQKMDIIWAKTRSVKMILQVDQVRLMEKWTRRIWSLKIKHVHRKRLVFYMRFIFTQARHLGFNMREEPGDSPPVFMQSVIQPLFDEKWVRSAAARVISRPFASCAQPKGAIGETEQRGGNIIGSSTRGSSQSI